MLNLGLLGRGIQHSRSKEMYEKLLGFEVNYHLLDCKDVSSILPLDKLFSQYELKGLSITYPYKKYFLNQVSCDLKILEKIGAINCITFRDGQFYATNTDYLAAFTLVKRDIEILKSHCVLLLGSGNMACVFKLVFEELSIPYIQMSRKDDGDLNKVDYFDFGSKGKNLFIINSCSRDFMFQAEVPEQATFWDMNYSFKQHELLSEKFLCYREGLDLLELQAKFALEFWEISNL